MNDRKELGHSAAARGTLAEHCSEYRTDGKSKARAMPWKVKKLRKIGPFWLPSRGPVEHVDLRTDRAQKSTHRPLFGHGHRHDDAGAPDDRAESR